MRKRNGFAVVAMVATLTLVAAACRSNTGGGGGGGGAAGGVDCSADQFGCIQVPAGQPFTLGTLLAISGDTADLGTDSQHGVQLAIDNLDGKLDGTDGQLLGHDVKLQNEDDGCSAEGGQAGATALVAVPNILAVIGTSCSSAALGVADKITSDKGILLISPSNTNPALTSQEAHQPFYLRTAHNDRIQGAIVSDFVLKSLNLKTAATINDESPYADGLAAAFRDNLTSNGGSVTDVEQINSADTDFKPVLTSIAQGKPDVLYFPDFNPACALIAKQAQDILPNTALIGSDGCLASQFLQTAGSAGNGVYASSPDVTVFQGGQFYKDTFLPAYKKEFGTAPTSVFHAHAFDATNILFDAVKKVAQQNDDGSITISRTALKDAIFATKDYDGVSGTITCTPLGDCATEVTIGIYKAPGWPVEGGSGDTSPVFSETKTLSQVK